MSSSQIFARGHQAGKKAEKATGRRTVPLPSSPVPAGTKLFGVCLYILVDWMRIDKGTDFNSCHYRRREAEHKAAEDLHKKTGAAKSVIPCGEKWSAALDNENNMRPGIEDYLGAGAILSKLNGSKSPEAQVCVGAYEHAKNRIEELFWDFGSGRELRQWGYEQDVRYCSQIDVSKTVPLLHENRFITFSGSV